MRQIISVVIPGALSILLFASCHKGDGNNAMPATDTLAQNVYTVVRSSDAKADGNILVSPFDQTTQMTMGRLMLMDGTGHLLNQQGAGAAVMNFRRWTINGQIRYTWFVFDPALYDAATTGYEQGYEVIADASLNELKRVNLLASGSVQDVSHQNLDAHDFILLGDNHYIAMGYLRLNVSNVPDSLSATKQAHVATPVIQEVNNGQVVWQWIGSDHPEFYGSSLEGNSFSDMTDLQDYMHMNAMTVDSADGNLICSFRNCDQVVKLNRSSGDVMWRIGGKSSDFKLTDDMTFLRQHDVTLTDDGHTLLIFDNGLAGVRPWSRVLELQLNETEHSFNGYRAYTIPEPFTAYMGSVQKMGRQYFIGGGTANYVLQVDYITGEKILEMNAGSSTYRAYKY